MGKKRNDDEDDEDFQPHESSSENSNDFSTNSSDSDPVPQRRPLLIGPPLRTLKKQKQTREPKPIVNLPIETQINNLNDLIKLGESYDPKFEYNCVLNLKTLNNLLEPLKELNGMIGLGSFKDQLINQLIFQLSGLGSTKKGERMLHTVLFGSPGCGKCLGRGTPVRMYDGTIKPVEEIKVGELIMGDDSTARTILSVTSGQEQMYRIDQMNGDPYTVNESHILSLKLSKNPKLIKTSQQSCQVTWFTKSGICSRTFSSASQDAETFIQTLPRKGSIIDICIKDYLQRPESWKKAFKGYKVGIDYPTKKVLIEPYVLGTWLSKNQDQKNKYIPVDYLINDRDTRLQLLAGLIDGYARGICAILLETDKRLAENIVELSRSLGFRTTINKCETYYRIYINTEANHEQNDSVMYDITVTPTKIDDYYGFEIDGNSRFLLGDFTVTHNTTVSRVLAKVYTKMGYLSKGQFISAKRADLIGKYLGHTAIKTLKVLESAQGGVLFIDEVYSLGNARQDDGDSFSKECIDTINQYLSEHADDFICIIAGYKEEVERCFFAHNPGLERRFPFRYTISGYSPAELLQIFHKFVSEHEWVAEPDSITVDFFQTNKEYFPHYGGDIAVFFDMCKMAHARRTFILPPENWKRLNGTDIQTGLDLYKKSKQLEIKVLPPSVQHLYM